MKTLTIEDCKMSLEEMAETDEPIVLTKSGEPVAAVFPFTRDDLDSLALSNNPAFLQLLEKSVQRAENEGWVPMADVKKQLGLS